MQNFLIAKGESVLFFGKTSGKLSVSTHPWDKGMATFFLKTTKTLEKGIINK